MLTSQQQADLAKTKAETDRRRELARADNEAFRQHHAGEASDPRFEMVEVKFSKLHNHGGVEYKPGATTFVSTVERDDLKKRGVIGEKSDGTFGNGRNVVGDPGDTINDKNDPPALPTAKGASTTK